MKGNSYKRYPTRLFRTWSLLSILLTSFIGCGKIDNYDAPGSTFYGNVQNSSGEPVQQRVQSTAGLKFCLYETDRENPMVQQFYAKLDGTFENSMLFTGDYRIRLEQTNFYPIEESLITLSQRTAHTYTVVPFCEVKNVSVRYLSGKKIGISFSLTREKNTDCKIISYSVYGHVSPYVDDMAVNHCIATSLLTTESDAELLVAGNTFQVVIDFDNDKDFDRKHAHIVKANHNNVYVRVAVMTAYPRAGSQADGTEMTYVNFSQVIPVTLPLD